MTDTSPEAVERLPKELRRTDEYAPLGHVGWEAADLIEALAAEIACLRAENATAYQRGWMNGSAAMQKMAVSGRQERVSALPIPDKEGEA